MQTNDKLREALVKAQTALAICEWPDGTRMEGVAELLRQIDAALAEPVKNCDVGTPEEQMKRQYDTMCNTTKACPDSDWSCKECFAKWAQMPYEEGGAK